MPDLFQRIAETLMQAKLRAVADNRTLRGADIATVLRETYPTLQEKPVRTPKVDAKQYGDRTKIPPAPDQVTAYSAAIGYPMNGAAWCDTYAQKGWKVGKERMKDWQAGVRNWKANQYGKGTAIVLNGHAVTAPAARDYSKL